jgi:hypothetical protein
VDVVDAGRFARFEIAVWPVGMSRQHATPILIPAEGIASRTTPLGLGVAGHGMSEAASRIPRFALSPR